MSSASKLANGWWTSVVAGAALAVSGVLAVAADMPGGYPPPPEPAPPPPPWYEPVTIDQGVSWYLRGDVGAHWGILTGAHSASPYPNPTDSSFKTGITGSLGVGLKSNWLRTDVTIDYAAPVQYEATIATPGDTTAKIQATTGLVNGYLDLGTWYHVTPYIGAGAGVSYVRAFDYVSTGAPPFSTDNSKYQWNFAFAGMAGIAYAVSHNLKMDLGYRYLNIGDVKTGSDAFGAMTFRNVAAHEVRIGLRWSFDEPRYPH
ncbi:MAG: outer membrane protein [Pseudolabrys sp.]